MGGVKCPYCGGSAELVTDFELYGQSYGGRRFWLCRKDRAWVGCHRNGKPLGTLANAELREWRMRAHAMIGPLWQSGRVSRHEMYLRLSHALGRDVHVGTSDVEGCKSIMYAAAQLWP